MTKLYKHPKLECIDLVELPADIKVVARTEEDLLALGFEVVLEQEKEQKFSWRSYLVSCGWTMQSPTVFTIGQDKGHRIQVEGDLLLLLDGSGDFGHEKLPKSIEECNALMKRFGYDIGLNPLPTVGTSREVDENISKKLKMSREVDFYKEMEVVGLGNVGCSRVIIFTGLIFMMIVIIFLISNYRI